MYPAIPASAAEIIMCSISSPVLSYVFLALPQMIYFCLLMVSLALLVVHMGSHGLSFAHLHFLHRIILRFPTLFLSVFHVYTYRLTCVITKVRSEVAVGSHMNVFCIACSTIAASVLMYRCVLVKLL